MTVVRRVPCESHTEDFVDFFADGKLRYIYEISVESQNVRASESGVTPKLVTIIFFRSALLKATDRPRRNDLPETPPKHDSDDAQKRSSMIGASLFPQSQIFATTSSGQRRGEYSRHRCLHFKKSLLVAISSLGLHAYGLI